jgi:hypothetical protein
MAEWFFAVCGKLIAPEITLGEKCISAKFFGANQG